MKPHPDNARLPQGDGGRATLNRMNEAHASMAAWGFSHIAPAKDAHALDLGCGGGANLAVLLESCPEGHATGLDYSEISIEIDGRGHFDASIFIFFLRISFFCQFVN